MGEPVHGVAHGFLTATTARAEPNMCDIGGGGKFQLTVNKIQRGGTEQVTIEVDPMDTVESVVNRLEENKVATLRHKGEFDDQPMDLTLLDVGISQAMEVDLQISCMMKGPPPP